MKDDVDVVLEIAGRLEVDVTWAGSLHTQPQTDLRGLETSTVFSHASRGPVGHYCDVAERKVWLTYAENRYVETILHEICHVVLTPPGVDLEEIAEDVLLLPFERVLARQCLSRSGYELVKRWQLDTQVDWWIPRQQRSISHLAEWKGHAASKYWRDSHAALRRLGVLAGGRVTWKRPRWDRVPEEFYRNHG